MDRATTDSPTVRFTMCAPSGARNAMTSSEDFDADAVARAEAQPPPGGRTSRGPEPDPPGSVDVRAVQNMTLPAWSRWLRVKATGLIIFSTRRRSGEIGIRTRLKIWRGHTHVGSSPTSGTIV